MSAPRTRTRRGQTRHATSVPNPEQVAVLAALASFRFFVEEAWPVVVPAEPFQPNWHIDAICAHLEAVAKLEIRRLLINIPPRFGKSTIVSVMFPAWLWLQDPTLRLLYSSYAQSLSTRDSVATRQLIESPWYQARWGSLFQIAPDQNEKTRFENNRKGYRLATSVGGANTGEGGDVIVADDPHNVKETESDVVRTTVVRWWNEVMSTRGNNPATARRIVVMQRVHEKDLAGDILEKGGYVHLNLPMEYEAKFAKASPIGWVDPRRTEGELLWPERYGPEQVAEQKKMMGAYAYAAQFQQRPAPLEGGMFKRSWWRFYKPEPAIVEGLVQKARLSCWSWDIAFKDSDTSDFVCGTAWVVVGADFYLLPLRVHDRNGFSATREAVKSMSRRWPKIAAKLVEDTANGPAIIDELKHTVGGLIPVKPEGGKVARAQRIQPYVEAGNVYLPDPSSCPWIEDFIQEFNVFQNGAHDDYVDSTSQAINWLLGKMHSSSGFVVWVHTKTWTPSGEAYRDPRYGDEPIIVRNERGDDRPHDVSNPEHRVECRACRAAFLRM